jgi:hypothetical protein
MPPKNIKINKTRGRPKKDQNEGVSHKLHQSAESLEDLHLESTENTFPELLLPPIPPFLEVQEDDDKIRSPDQIFNDCLIPSDEENNDILNQLRNSINDSVIYPPDNELQLALELSMKENTHYNDNQKEINEMLVLSKIEFEEHLKNKKAHRKRILSNFYRKLHFLHYPYIIEQLNEYFHCNIDIIYLDENTYKSIFEIIDSYYKTPNEKGKKCAITEEEDNMLRLIFMIK